MMLDELLKSKKITTDEYELYLLFRMNDLGRKIFEKMMIESFMDEPINHEYSETGFAFYDGRRSVFRDIRKVIMLIEIELTKEKSNE